MGLRFGCVLCLVLGSDLHLVGLDGAHECWRIDCTQLRWLELAELGQRFG